MSEQNNDNESPDNNSPRKFEDLPPAAQRALKEAQARREKIDAAGTDQPAEIDGRGGKDPARYGDWEVKGLAVDF
ncbi:MAG: DUF1674 domain-containing protein [Pseudomonadota bacterium]